MRTIITIITVIIISILLSGCAMSATKLTRQTIKITSNPTHADVTIYNVVEGEVHQITPVTVKLNRERNTYSIAVSKQGYSNQEYMLRSTISNAAWVDYCFGLATALVGIVGGFSDYGKLKDKNGNVMYTEDGRERKTWKPEWITIMFGGFAYLFSSMYLVNETNFAPQKFDGGSHINATLRLDGRSGDTIRGGQNIPINAAELSDAVKRAVNSMQADILSGALIAVLSIASSDQNASSELIDMISANLFQTRKFPLVSRNALNTLRQEQAFQLSGDVDDKSAIELGRLVGANVVITGRVTRYGREPRLILQAIDIETAKIVSIAIEDQSRSPLARTTGSDDMVKRAIQKMNNDIPANTTLAVLNIAAGDRFTSSDMMNMAMLNLHQGKRFSLVNRQALNVLRTEQSFQYSGEVDNSSAVQLGRLIGAEVVVTGKMTKNNNQNRLILHALETQTARVVSIAVEDENGTPRFNTGLDGAIRQAVNKMQAGIPAGSTVAVLNIASNDRFLSADIIDNTMFNLHQSKRFTLVNRAALNVLREEQKFQFSGEVADNTAIELGKLIGARVVITGSWRDSDNRLMLQALDTQTAQVLGMAIEDVK